MAEDSETVSKNAGGRPAKRTILERLKRRIKRPFRFLKYKGTTEQKPPPPMVQKEQRAYNTTPADSPSVPVKKTSLDGNSNRRTEESEIYDRGLIAIDILKKLAGLTRPGFPNPVVPIIESLIAVLTQLQVSHSY